ncbi:MAG TPA: PEP-CTERM sorting domain-containing protein [Vicinamibacterales bacterium]|nr:PEP-CTERM sorting domain-containing protein [Vicinamibacterales bacterium]
MVQTSWRATLTRLGVAATLMILAVHATAAPVIGIQIDSLGGGYAGYSTSQEGSANPDGSFGLKGFVDGATYGTSFNCDWSIVVNEDPQITSTFTLTNISGVTQTFVMTVTLPIAALGPSTVQGGYFGDPGLDTYGDPLGTRYTDASGNSDVTLNTIGGTPFYQALVNGILSQGLGNFAPAGLNANGGPGIYGSLSQQTWGTPIPAAPFGPASVNMQIRWTFSLTAGDSVSTKGFFQVERVPEPASAVLLGLGLAALAAARRRV